jgi:hypothetical protein
MERINRINTIQSARQVTDQGAAFEEAYLCSDLAVVLLVCRQTGQLDPGVVWEPRPAEP